MKIGKFIRESFNFYLDNPIILIPFLFLGIVDSILTIFASTHLKNKLAELGIESVGELFTSNASSIAIQIIVNYIALIILVYIFISVISSFVEAYSIGLAKSMPKKGELSFKDGLGTIGRGSKIFLMKVTVFVLVILGIFGIFIPSVLIFGPIGIALAFLLIIVYILALVAITFFASQSIVLEKKGVIAGIGSSYHFLKKNLEGVIKIIIFMAFASLCLVVMRQVGLGIGKFFLSEISMTFFEHGLNLILFSLIFAPYLLILKTFYFIKQKKIS